MSSVEAAIQEVMSEYQSCQWFPIVPQWDLVFEERVKLLCFSCPKYGKRHTCPPSIPVLDWQKIVSEYRWGSIIVSPTSFVGKITWEQRVESSVHLHQLLLKLEHKLYSMNHPFARAFIGGCCKLCEREEQCPPNCARSYHARIPLEAIGVNVQATLAKKGVHIVFPPEGHFVRVGALLW